MLSDFVFFTQKSTITLYSRVSDCYPFGGILFLFLFLFLLLLLLLLFLAH